MKTTFTTNAIRAALVLLLSSTATPRGFQENGAAGNRQGSRAAAPARSGGPLRTAQVSRQMPASPRSTPASQGARTNSGMSAGNTNRNVNTNINQNMNINRNGNVNALNGGSGPRRSGSNPAPGALGSQGSRGTNQPQQLASNFNSNTNINRNTNINTNVNRNGNSNVWSRPTGGNGQGGQGSGNQGARGTNQSAGTQTGRGTGQPPTQLASNTNVNKNININKNINVNQNTNSNGWNRGTDSRGGSGFSGGRGTDVRGPQGSAFNGNSNFNSNVNINRNTNINVNRNGGGDVGRARGRERHIDDGPFRSHFGRDHQFHLNQGDFAGGRPWFQFSGVSFQAVDAWPASWRYSDPVYVDSVGGSYVLCNPMHPGVFVPMNISDCASCSQAPQMVASNANCVDCGAAPADPNGIPTLTPGQTMDQVVAMLGTPKDIVDLGARQIYLYSDMRVTFLGGRLSDVR